MTRYWGVLRIWPLLSVCAILRDKMMRVFNSSNLVNELKKLGIGSLIADLLEMGKPLGVVGAQLIYMFEPMTGDRSKEVRELGQSLEDPQRFQDLINELRLEEPSNEQP